jgi:hypothetical protein
VLGDAVEAAFVTLTFPHKPHNVLADVALRKVFIEAFLRDVARILGLPLYRFAVIEVAQQPGTQNQGMHAFRLSLVACLALLLCRH